MPSKYPFIPTIPNICESCRDKARLESSGLIDSDDLESLDIALDILGDDIGDHLCDEVETRGDIRCGCSCHLVTKRLLRIKS